MIETGQISIKLFIDIVHLNDVMHNLVHQTRFLSHVSHWSLLSGVYARESKISHTGVKCVTCHGLHIVEKDVL